MISLRPSLITEHHSVSSLNDLAREASPCSRYLRPARDEDTTCTVGGNCSRVDGDKRTERIGPPTYSPDASVDPTDARLPNDKAQRTRTDENEWLAAPRRGGPSPLAREVRPARRGTDQFQAQNVSRAESLTAASMNCVRPLRNGQVGVAVTAKYAKHTVCCGLSPMECVTGFRRAKYVPQRGLGSNAGFQTRCSSIDRPAIPAAAG